MILAKILHHVQNSVHYKNTKKIKLFHYFKCKKKSEKPVLHILGNIHQKLEWDEHILHADSQLLHNAILPYLSIDIQYNLIHFVAFHQMKLFFRQSKNALKIGHK